MLAIAVEPGDRNAPVVMHLVEWGTPTPAMLTLRTAAFFGGGQLRARLLVPPKYGKTAHERAENSKDYSKLAAEQDVKVFVEGELTRVDLPPLNPWGILVVEKGD